MARRSRDMADLDRPVTRREFLDFQTALDARLETFATKDELREGLEAVRSEMAEGFAEMRGYVEAAEQRLRTHFDVVAESFRTEFRNLYEWTHTNVVGLATRVDSVETSHGAQLESLNLRVTRLEKDSERVSRPGRRRR
jgi:hypothetical protein